MCDLRDLFILTNKDEKYSSKPSFIYLEVLFAYSSPDVSVRDNIEIWINPLNLM